VLRAVRFSQVYAFMYSPRPGTRAAELEDSVPKAMKQERLQRALALYESINAEESQKYLDAFQEVLIEGPDPKKRNAMHGRTEGNRHVTVNGDVSGVGDLVLVRITAVRAHSLEGDVATRVGAEQK
ncbi:MAG TPA: TRAM domain-containing protein, partial [Candidatus Hydrogenedentes bacterium]|nr:TRAM domain-containing protein [Candidatus Hydrogenedentota bacterium]